MFWTTLACAWTLSVSLQTAPVPDVVRVYRPNIADEDWSFLKDRSKRSDLFDPIKYIPLWGGRSYLTLGGEARFRPEGFRVRRGPGEPSASDSFFFQRYLFSADWHLGQRFRLYGELQSGLVDGKSASPRPTDKDTADMHQAFVEVHTPRDRPHQLVIKIGRQEMTIGSSRLISASQGLNVKRSFDGVVGGYRQGRWQFEGGAARLVAVGGGAFDDSSTPEQEFWGVAAQRSGTGLKGAAASGYYLRVDRHLSLYAQGTGPERRHTVGGKFAGVWKAFDFNYDLIGQWGEFAGVGVQAWAMAIENGVRVRAWPMRPRFTLRMNSATGDHDPSDPRLQSFNPLFPGSSYSGMVGLLGPTNLTDVTPGVQLAVPHGVLVVFESPFYFRSSINDSVYSIELRPILNGQANTERSVGTNPAFVVVWQATPHISVSGVITRFVPGAFLKGSFIEHGFAFYSLSFTYRF